jgi:hypothetical protein
MLIGHGAIGTSIPHCTPLDHWGGSSARPPGAPDLQRLALSSDALWEYGGMQAHWLAGKCSTLAGKSLCRTISFSSLSCAMSLYAGVIWITFPFQI